MANEVRIRFTAKDDVSSVIDKIRDKAGVLSKTDIGKGMIQGAGMAAWNSLGLSVGKVADAVVDFVKTSVEGAIEEQAGISKLDAALRSNVAGWDGNTAAVERSQKAGMDLGFTDDDLRDSMTKLLPVTKNVADAQKVQAVAMDLARFKGISLADASLAIGRAMMGNKKILKELGISVSDAGTGYQTLAEIQKVVAGQSEAFAKTTAGSMEALSAHVDALKNELGAKLVPAVGYATEAFLGLADAMDGTAEAGDRMRGVSDFGAFLAHLNPTLAGAADNYDRMKKAQEDEAKAADEAARAGYESARSWDTASEASAGLREKTWAAVPGIGAMAGYLGDAADNAWDGAAAFRDLKTAVSDLTSSVKDQQDLTLMPAKLQVMSDDINRQIRDDAKTRAGLEQAVRDAKTAKDKKAAQVALDEFNRQAALRLTALKNEFTLQKIEYDGMRTYAAAAGLQTGQSYIIGVTKGLAGTVLPDGHVVKAGEAVNVDLLPGHASGGFASPYTSFIAGERGPELIRTGSSGASIDPSPSVSGSGGGVTIKLVVDGREMAAVVDRHLYYKAARAPRSPYAS